MHTRGTPSDLWIIVSMRRIAYRRQYEGWLRCCVVNAIPVQTLLDNHGLRVHALSTIDPDDQVLWPPCMLLMRHLVTSCAGRPWGFDYGASDVSELLTLSVLVLSGNRDHITPQRYLQPGIAISYPFESSCLRS